MLYNLTQLLEEKGRNSPGNGVQFSKPLVVKVASDRPEDFKRELIGLQQRVKEPPQIIVAILRRDGRSQVKWRAEGGSGATFMPVAPGGAVWVMGVIARLFTTPSRRFVSSS